jgi:hypothetical protein
VHHDDVLDAVSARELEGRLQPLADAEDRERTPGLVEHVDHLAGAGSLAVGALVQVRDHGSLPGGGARHHDAERCRVVERRQVEDNRTAREAETGRRRAVEHPS